MSQPNMNVTYYAVTGGILSAFGSALGKLPGLFDSWIWAGLCFLLMVTVNSIGFMMFAKSLNASATSLRPTLLSSASSYFTSAVLGLMVFTEETSVTWWAGTFLILLGILAISSEKTKVD